MEVGLCQRVLMFVGGNGYPPGASGTSTILYNVLQGLDSSQLDVLTEEPVVTNSTSLPFQTTTMPRPLLSKLPLVWRLAFLEGILRYIWAGLRLTRAPRYRRTFLIFPDTASVIGGYIVSRLRNVENHVFLIDLLSDSRLNKVEYLLLKLFEKKLLQKSHTVYCMTRGVIEFYQRKVRREYGLLRHCVAVDGNNVLITGQDRTGQA